MRNKERFLIYVVLRKEKKCSFGRLNEILWRKLITDAIDYDSSLNVVIDACMPTVLKSVAISILIAMVYFQ